MILFSNSGRARKAVLLKSTAALAICLAVSLVICAPRNALASMADLAGVTPSRLSLSGATIGTSDDFASCYDNPASLALMPEGITIGFAFNYLHSGLEKNDERVDFNEHFGVTAGLGGIIPFTGYLKNRVGAGLLMFVPTLDLMWLHLIMRDDPSFPLYENRFQRLILRPTLAYRVWERLSLGVSVNYYVNLTGRVESHQGPNRGLDATANLELLSSFTADFAVSYEPIDNLRLGFLYRMKHYANTHFITKNRIGSLVLDLDIQGAPLFEPAVLEIGGAYTFKEIGLTLAGALAYRFWSDYPGPLTVLEADVPSGTPQNKHFYPAEISSGAKNTFEVKAGAVKKFRFGAFGLDLMAGYGFENAAIGKQTGETNLLDGDKHKVGFGFSAGLFDLGAGFKRISLDFGSQFQFLSKVTSYKNPASIIDEDAEKDGLQTLNPGYPKITSGGYVAAFSVMLTIQR